MEIDVLVDRMPAIAQKAKKTNGKSGKRSSLKVRAPWSKQVTPLLAMFVCGCALGLAAPGFNQWYLAWFGLIPLLLGISTSSSIFQAAVRGLLFGFGYNLVYQSWYLQIQPLDWLGFNWWQGILLSLAAWLFAATHQGLITAIFAVVCRCVPQTGGFFPAKIRKQFCLPAPFLIPLLWVLVHNKIGNAHDALGVPWSMIEYTQYKQVAFIQFISIIGGLGLGCLIVFANVSIAILIQALRKKKGAAMLTAPSKEHAFYQMLATVVVIAGCYTVGAVYPKAVHAVGPHIKVSVVQGNINIEMQRTEHRANAQDLFAMYSSMLDHAPAGLSVWSESALPSHLSVQPDLQRKLGSLAVAKHLDVVLGAMDQDRAGNPYNSAYGVTSNGEMLTEIYHKRYLVPFGEYTPWLINYFPAWIKRLTNTPAGGGFQAGKMPVVLDLNVGRVGPLICLETLSPELAASSVRAGGQLLVNVSDLSWFHNSIIGDQMVAFSVLRAIENRRYFIFAANTGPSAIIDPSGHILHISRRGTRCVITGAIQMCSGLTPFTQWFVF